MDLILNIQIRLKLNLIFFEKLPGEYLGRNLSFAPITERAGSKYLSTREETCIGALSEIRIYPCLIKPFSIAS